MAWIDFDLPFGLTPIPSALPADHQRYWIAAGPLGTDQTIQRMRKVVSSTLDSMRKGVTRGKRIFGIRKLIGEIIQPCEPKNYYCYAQKLYEYCRDQIKYTFDPVGVELVESPELILLESKIADCDSIVTVLATLYEAIGLPARFVTVKADPLRPDDYSHVFLEVNLPKHGWVAADPTMPQKQFGWRPDPKFPSKNWPASLDPDSDVRDDILEPKPVAGLGYYRRHPVDPYEVYNLRQRFTVPIVAPPQAERNFMYGFGDYLTLPQTQQARALMDGMGRYLMGGSGGMGQLEEAQKNEALMMVSTLKSYLPSLKTDLGRNLVGQGITAINDYINMGDWSGVLSAYAAADQAYQNDQKSGGFLGMSTKTLMIVGAVGLGLFFLMRRK